VSEANEGQAKALLKRLDRELDAIKMQIEQVLSGQRAIPETTSETSARQDVRAAYEGIIRNTKEEIETEYDPTRKAVLQAIIAEMDKIGAIIEHRAEAILEREQD
jgi:hypothetical protein